MKIPKHIDELLEQRAESASKFTACDAQIALWLEKNNIEVSSDHILTGACSIVEPYSSIEHIRDCIREKGSDKP